MSFSDGVERAAQPAPKVWRLMVWDVHDCFGGVLSRLGFRQTKKNPKNWWRIFDPAAPADKTFAERCKAVILAAGLKGSWQQVEHKIFTPRPSRGTARKFDKHPPPPGCEGFGGKLNAQPISGSWRMKKHSR